MYESTHPRVAIIGAGFGGIVTAIKLQRAGLDFVIFERSEGVGGTWWDNRYPGAETDAASHLYAYSFAPYDWTRTHVRRAEIQGYLEHVAEAFDLMPSIRFKETVEEVAWDDATSDYVVRTSSGEAQRFQFVVSAVGLFASSKLPDWPGLEDFAGEVVHTAEWDETLDLTGKKVAVVGVGSSATQVVPTVAPDAASVTVYQRQPGWVLPKGDRDFSALERRVFRWSITQRLNRIRLYLRQERREWHGAVFRAGQQDEPAIGGGGPGLHRRGLRRSPRPGRGADPRLPFRRQADRGHQRILPRAAARGRTPGSSSSGLVHQHRDCR